MSRLLYRIITAGALLATVTTGAFSQAIEHDHDHDHNAAEQIVCGSILFNDGKEMEALENTRINNPGLYQQMVERAKSTHDRRGMLSSGSEVFPFLIRNRVTGQYDQIYALLVFNGKWARIWVDTRDTGLTRVKNVIPALARGLDTATAAGSRNPGKGIIENDQEIFGMPPVNRFEPGLPTQDFLLTDIEDGMDNGFVGGFFSPWDQTDQPGSNKMNLLYIDSKEGVNSGTRALLSTLAHEFQHLIHYRTNQNSQTLFNEGCSEVASIMLGYVDRDNGGYIRTNTNQPLFKWNYDDGTKLLIDYQRAMTFVYYLYEQYGEAFIGALANTKSESMDRIADALRSIGRSPNWQETLSGYVVANYIGKTYPDSRYVYRTKLSSLKPNATLTYDGNGEMPSSSSTVVQQYAAAYVVYNNPGGIKVKFESSSQPYRIMAMLYKTAPEPVQVLDLEPGQVYTLAHNGGSAPYDKIVFGIANHSFNSHTVKWTVDRVTLGVEDDNSAADGDLAISEVAPNPASGNTQVSFTNARTGEVSIELYNTKGELVRTVLENERYEPGQHSVMVNTSDLSNGVYMVRVLQAGQMTSRVLVVLNK